MARFNFSKIQNPVETSVTILDETKSNPIVFRLCPVDTAFAFDGKRFQSFMAEGRIDDCREFQFRLGLNRVVGWQDVFDEAGNAVAFTPENFGAFTRLVESIHYIMEIGRLTLEELGVFPSASSAVSASGGEPLAPRADMVCEATVIQGQELVGPPAP